MYKLIDKAITEKYNVPENVRPCNYLTCLILNLDFNDSLLENIKNKIVSTNDPVEITKLEKIWHLSLGKNPHSFQNLFFEVWNFLILNREPYAPTIKFIFKLPTTVPELENFVFYVDELQTQIHPSKLYAEENGFSNSHQIYKELVNKFEAIKLGCEGLTASDDVIITDPLVEKLYKLLFVKTNAIELKLITFPEGKMKTILTKYLKLQKSGLILTTPQIHNVIKTVLNGSDPSVYFKTFKQICREILFHENKNINALNEAQTFIDLIKQI